MRIDGCAFFLARRISSTTDEMELERDGELRRGTRLSFSVRFTQLTRVVAPSLPP
jgi:hypothetical protein